MKVKMLLADQVNRSTNEDICFQTGSNLLIHGESLKNKDKDWLRDKICEI